MHPEPGRAEDDQRQDQDDDEHNPGDGAGIAHMEVGEALLVEEHAHHIGALAGAAAGNQGRGGVVLQLLDGLVQQGEENDGGNLRDGDVEEALPPARAVNLGSLVQGGGHVLQRRQEHDHGRAELPDFQPADHLHGRALGAQEMHRVQPQGGEHGVDHAAVHEHQPPQKGDGHAAAEQRRDVVQRADHVDALDVAVEEQCHGQGQDQLARHGVYAEEQRHLQRIPEVAVLGEELDVVVETYFNEN